jgi:hypothetical protein
MCLLVVWMAVLACLVDGARVRSRGLGFGCVIATTTTMEKRKSSIETAVYMHFQMRCGAKH